MESAYLFTLYPEVDKKVRDEIEKHIPTLDDLTFENLKKLTYFDCVQNEIIRYCGPGGFLFWRESLQDQMFGNVPVQKGLYIGANSIPSHFNPKYYKDPQEFRPERWEKECDNLPPYAFCGFSAGPRSCIGKNLSILESKVILVIMLKRYKSFKLPV
jgi:cytochrome P450